jgi:hypothetical protein
MTLHALGSEWATTPHAAATPTARDLEWAAGFLEGEGAFVSRNCEMVRAMQRQREPLDRLARLFGGSVRSYLAGRTKLGERTPIWHWQVSGGRARGVMLTLYHLLSTRRRAQIRAALDRVQ